MYKYTQVILKDFAQQLVKISVTPSDSHLIQASPDEELKLLPGYKSRMFHQNVVQLLFYAQMSVGTSKLW